MPILTRAAAELLLGARAGKTIGCQASGEVILATGRQEGSKLAHVVGRARFSGCGDSAANG